MNGYDVIVIGGGHAGCEAALAAARMGRSVLMLVDSPESVALMPCNPSIGGPAKGDLVRELDALGGEQGLAADASTLHLRWLNTSKGLAVRALRAQCDPAEYANAYITAIFSQDGLKMYQSNVRTIEVEGGAVVGVVTASGERFAAKNVIVACGTYMKGVVHIGMANFPSGPLGRPTSSELSSCVEALGITMGRFRTDTTPRLDASTVDWASLPAQHSDPEPEAFSHWGPKRVYDVQICAQTRTNSRTKDIITKNLDRSPLATARLASKGPRYCPSIDDKTIRFPDRESHPIFLEPVGRAGREVYMQNFSTSMPPDVQLEMVHTLPGCERAIITRPGYGIEYDRIDPTQLEPWLEAKSVRGLFFAGQVCGTSGYEEAASQGLIAGINAALSATGGEHFVLARDEAYIGVLIDDLTTRGVDEPYRMLPSRCEFRLMMRHDNADDRLCRRARDIGLLDDEKWRVYESRRTAVDAERERLSSTRVRPTDRVNEILRSVVSSPLDESVPALQLLARPEISWRTFTAIVESDLDADLGTKIETTVKYAGYIDREKRAAARLASMERLVIPDHIDYRSMNGLSAEASEKLSRVRPRTLGAASRIPGVNAVDVQLVHVCIERARRERA